MNTKLLGALVVGLAVVGIAVGAVMTGFGPAPGGDSGTPAPTPESTGTVYDGSGGSDGTSDGSTATETAPPFSFGIDRIEECGQTCRDVTATLYNDQETGASDVTVYTQIYAGNSTSSDDRVWSGTEEVGSMEAGGSHTSTNRVELTFTEAREVQNKGGWITVVTTVETAETTVSFKDRRQVV